MPKISLCINAILPDKDQSILLELIAVCLSSPLDASKFSLFVQNKAALLYIEPIEYKTPFSLLALA